ncbi:hypothetical protein IKH83_03565 [Candidatus Saccharibacteria bacterium]|nr:hypothetical protein [Candidatus Saccharibacteria bacterium]
MMAKKKQKKYLFFIALVLVAAVVISGVFLLALKSASSGKIALDPEYYNNADQIYLDTEEYEQLIREKKSFIVVSYASICNSKILDFVDDFSEENKVAFIDINWEKLKGTEAREVIKYPPTVFIVEKGKIRAYLDSDAEEDVEKYNDYEVFSAWIKENISF